MRAGPGDEGGPPVRRGPAATLRLPGVPRLEALPANIRGALWIILSCVMFSGMVATVKVLGQRLDPLQITFFRSFCALVAVLPFVIWAGPSSVRTARPGAHVTRTLFGITAMFCAYYAVTHLPLATATAITFAKPLFLILLAIIFLGEKPGWRRAVATVVGFLGVLVMLRPSGVDVGGGGDAAGLIEPAAAVALFGTVLVAAVVVQVKRLAQTEAPVTILFYFGLVSSIATIGPAIVVWTAPTPLEYALAVLVGVLGAAGQWCNVRGLRVGEATAVMPFDYFRLLFAGLLGFALFAEVPGLWMLAGSGIVIASSLALARIESRRRPVSPAE